MVEWKGHLEGDVGQKARMLDRAENFQVPNFFVITSEELEQIFENGTSAEQILNASIGSDHRKEIKDAYKDIGMSSEVRNSTGKAKNLVGGQRNNQFVSIRVSNKQAHAKYKLNVGSSDLFEALKDVAGSYYENTGEMPSIIVQKMIESEYSGSAMTGDGETPGLVEVVEGLGTSLEEGENRPYFYTLDSGEIDSKKPEEHRKITRNPMNGEERQKKVEPEMPFEGSEIKELLGKLDRQDINAKFAYKRGDFYIVDVWKEKPRYEVLKNPEIQGLKVSEGDISGTVGQEITYSETTLSPEKYRKHLVTGAGGYTSRDAEKAREEGKTAVFSFAEKLENGQRINMKEQKSGRKEKRQARMDGGTKDSFPFSRDSKDSRDTKAITGDTTNSPVATEILPLNPRNGRGVFTSPPYGDGYVLSDKATGENQFSRKNYVDTAEQAFVFDGDNLMLDVRKLGRESKEMIKYLDAEKKVLIVNQPKIDVLKEAVVKGYDAVSCEKRFIDDLERKVQRAEKKFMLEKIREIDSN
ncbi:MAG: hypothetical protein BRC28_02150 [Nanohaloarchaea archaeon SW_4_43_9]|nr:MAG: hypothetical protein BRC28_02150 [Nanohaloarchaea archaeon SW_4_43_9]